MMCQYRNSYMSVPLDNTVLAYACLYKSEKVRGLTLSLEALLKQLVLQQKFLHLRPYIYTVQFIKKDRSRGVYGPLLMYYAVGKFSHEMSMGGSVKCMTDVKDTMVSG